MCFFLPSLSTVSPAEFGDDRGDEEEDGGPDGDEIELGVQ